MLLPRFSQCLALALGLVAGATAGAHAQEVKMAVIDGQLSRGIDLRSVAFEGCLDLTKCEVDGLTIEAFRQNIAGEWLPALLYWDPVDGFGVKDGGQNDEIDFDEKLVITFRDPTDLKGLWLSDLFIGEGAHYGAPPKDGKDAETGQVAMEYAAAVTQEFEVSGDRLLPDISFNRAVFGNFLQEGDLRWRLLVDGNTMRIVAAGKKEGSGLVAVAGVIDPDKEQIFSGVETVERDDAELLRLIDGAVMFPVGTRNAEILASVAANSSSLATLYKRAVLERAFGDETNGEVSTSFGAPILTKRVTFTSPTGTSNDFSVAGFMVN